MKHSYKLRGIYRWRFEKEQDVVLFTKLLTHNYNLMTFQPRLGKMAPAKKCTEKRKDLSSTKETVTWEYPQSIHGMFFKRHPTWHYKKSRKFTMIAIGSSDVFMVPGSMKLCAKAVGGLEKEKLFWIFVFVFEGFLKS